MIWIIVLLILSLVLAAALFVLFSGLPDSRTVPGKRVQWMIIALGACLVLLTGLSTMILYQEQTGVETGLSGGVESDARQWVSRYATSPPRKDQAGDNIRIMRDGIDFINSHPSLSASPEGQRVLGQYGNVPRTPTRLLTKQEENQYFEGAQAVYNLIASVANRADGA